jgi:protein arginine N-methyltransferase 5
MVFFCWVLGKILVSLPIQQIILDDNIENSECHSETDEDETWRWWSKIRTMCEESTKLGLILGNKNFKKKIRNIKKADFFLIELTADLPSESKQDRWFAEPVKALVIPTSVFLLNKCGFPVLSKAHQRCVNKFFKAIKHNFFSSLSCGNKIGFFVFLILIARYRYSD